VSTRLYDSALEGRWTGYDVTGADPLSIALVDSSYVFDATDDFFDDVTGQLGSTAALTSVSVSGGDLLADDGVVSGVGMGDIVKGIVVFNDSGSPATSPLLGFIDRNADTTPISLTGNGTDINVPWPDGIVATLAVPA
jgi:hypothetical protein